jgi:hypothetical protein
VFVYDGMSDDLSAFFQKNIHDLDRATGAGITLSSIDHPNIMGPEYERRRTSETIARQVEAAKTYDRLIVERGSRDHHRRRETDDLIERLNVSREDLPCIVFLTSPRHDPAPILTIQRHWLSTPSLQVALRDALVRHLANDHIIGLGWVGTTTAELVERLRPVLAAITADVEFAEADEVAKGKRQPPVTSMPAPPGTTWAQVQIKFVDGHTVDVTVSGKRASLNYQQMGFVDRRTGRPDKQWELLESFANGHAEFSWGSMTNRRRYEKRVEALSRKLKLFFHLSDAPFRLDAKRRGWRANFLILPED